MRHTIGDVDVAGRPRNKTFTHPRLYKVAGDPLPYAEATAKALAFACALSPLQPASPVRTWNPSSRGPATSPIAIERPRGGV